MRNRTANQKLQRIGRSCLALARNPCYVYRGFMMLSKKSKIIFFTIFFLLSVFVYFRATNWCEIKYSIDAKTYREMYETLEIQYCTDLVVDQRLRNYHYMFLQGNYHSHGYFLSWKQYHNLNITFYSERPRLSSFNGKYENHVNVSEYLAEKRPHMMAVYSNLSLVEKADYLRYF